MVLKSDIVTYFIPRNMHAASEFFIRSFFVICETLSSARLCD